MLRGFSMSSKRFFTLIIPSGGINSFSIPFTSAAITLLSLDITQRTLTNKTLKTSNFTLFIAFSSFFVTVIQFLINVESPLKKERVAFATLTIRKQDLDYKLKILSTHPDPQKNE